MRNKLIVMILALLSVYTSTAMAAVTQTDYDKNFSDNTITVKGSAQSGEQVSIQILKDGEVSDSTIEESVVYVNQYKADDDGKFCFVARVHKSGKYNIFVSGEDITQNSVKLSELPIIFYNSSDYANVIKQLNQAVSQADENSFCNILKENTEKLGFDDNINQIVDISKLWKTMYSGLNGTALPDDKYDKNRDYYKNCAMMIAANDGKLSSIYNYAGNIIENNPTLLKYWKQYITSPEKEAYAAGKLRNRNLSDVNDLEKNISEVLILTATRYPNGYAGLKDLYSDFSNILGVNSVSENVTIYSKLAGKDYANITELNKAYSNAVSSSNIKENTGGSGGSGGGSRITMTGNYVEEISGADITAVHADAIPLKFIDLGSVRWAYPSISALFDLGIVNGASDTEFLPEREVRREEFTKMLVIAMGRTVGKYQNKFSDVPAHEWYADYVNYAYSEGIISGMTDTMFGVSKNIIRQDMAVMIYRSMLSAGYQKTSAVLEFSDKDDITGYAQEAVAELSKAGIISGRGNNMFAPKQTATRAEAAVIIERALKYWR